jgi:hypothetical protein
VAASADPCASIAHLTAEHVVDGTADEFCGAPAFQLNLETAAFVEPPPLASTSSAEMRVAWSVAGLHLHVRVTDSNVLLVPPPEHWHGDTAQLFVSSVEPSSGVIPGADGAATQLFMTPPSDTTPAAIRSPYTSGIPAGYQYAARLWAEGYEVELQLPWPGGFAPGSGATIGFDFVVGVKDDATTPSIDFEYGLYEGDLGGATTTAECQAFPDAPQHVWCDSRHWCRPTLE